MFHCTSVRFALALCCLTPMLACATAEQPSIGGDSSDPGGGADSVGGSGSSEGGHLSVGGAVNSSGAANASGAANSSGAAGSGNAAQGGSSANGGASSAGGAPSAGASSAGAANHAGATSGGAANGGAANGGAPSAGAANGGAPSAGAANGGAPSAGATGTAGSGAGGASGTVLFSDDFEDGSTSSWVTAGSGGVWAIASDGSNVYAQTAEAGSTLLISAAGSTAWTDQVVQARVKITAFSGSSTSYTVGIFARYDGTDYYSLIVHTDGSVAIRKDKTTLGNATAAGVVAVGTWYTLRLSVVGSTLTGYVNGALQLTETDSSLTSGGIALSMQSATAEFDDVQVTSP